MRKLFVYPIIGQVVLAWTYTNGDNIKAADKAQCGLLCTLIIFGKITCSAVQSTSALML